MTVDVAIGDRTHVVEMTGTEGRYQAVLDGRARPVDAARAGDTWSLLIGPRSYEVRMFEQAAGELIVHVNGRTVAARLPALSPGWRSVAGRRRRGEPAPDAGSGPCRVVAPMPGRIVRVLVKPGDTVAARQGLVVVEAMKMENELRAARAGTVTEVRVSEGMSVEANTILAIVG